MARRRRRGGRRGFRIGKWVNLGFKVLGATVALSPSFRGIQTMASGDFRGGTDQIVYDYVGLVPSSGQFNATKTVQGVGTVVAGIVLAKLGSMLARRL